MPKLRGPGNPAGAEPVPSSVLINGLGQGFCGPDGGPPCARAVLRAAPSVCGRGAAGTLLRAVNGGAMAAIVLHLSRPAGPPLVASIVALDGVPVARKRLQAPLRLAPGQRADLEVCTSARGRPGADPAAPAWLVAVMDGALFDGPPTANASVAVLDFRGDGAAPAAAPAVDLSSRGLDPGASSLPPAGGWALAAPPPPTRTHTLTLEGRAGGDGAAAFYVNGVSHDPAAVDPPDAPSLLEREAGPTPEGLGPPPRVPPPARAPAVGAKGWHILPAALGDVVDLVINNHDTGEHPMHVHGHAFWVMALGKEGGGDARALAADALPLAARDTAVVPPNSHAVLRLVAASPGPWYVHCHVAWHAATGLALVLQVA